jgi:hypothetical protein
MAYAASDEVRRGQPRKGGRRKAALDAQLIRSMRISALPEVISDHAIEAMRQRRRRAKIAGTPIFPYSPTLPSLLPKTRRSERLGGPSRRCSFLPGQRSGEK